MILSMEVRGVEAYFLCLMSDYSVDFIHYRNILIYYHHLYEDYYNYA